MIKVAVSPEKQPVVEEFFELFKTAWSFYQKDEPCTVLLTDGSAPLDVQADVYFLFSSAEFPDDKPSRKAGNDCGFRFVQITKGNELPLYNAPRLFSGVNDALIKDKEAGLAVAYSGMRPGGRIVRVGYDLFDEIERLLSSGQPPENAGYPALDRHIAFLRQTILTAGFPVVEIPPAPSGYDFMMCLTHDVDFVSIRNHGLDNTVRGFICRAVIGSIHRLAEHRLTLRQVLTNWLAVLSLPFVHLGFCKDFWMQFETYRQIEGSRRSTFFMIPFRDRQGREVLGPHPERRAVRYDVTEVSKEVAGMQEHGWEFCLHGIDAWCDGTCARLEKNRISSVTGKADMGVRIHWLCTDERSSTILDEAGFEYDSTNGYNETIGFRAGTSQVFRPLRVNRLLEIPLHIQDVALFYPAFLDLDESTAWKRCMELLEHQKAAGGVVTVLWHMRSPAPERLWGAFYKRLLDECANEKAWFGTARETADWFRSRRRIKLSVNAAPNGLLSIGVRGSEPESANIAIRIYYPGTQSAFMDIPWDGRPEIKVNRDNETAFYRLQEKGETPA